MSWVRRNDKIIHFLIVQNDMQYIICYEFFS